LPPCTIDTNFSGFKNGYKAAFKRHRSFAPSLEEVLEAIEKDPLSRGDRIPLGPELHVRKIRIGCPGDKVSPRDGHRLIVQITEVGQTVVCRCLSLYYKQQQTNISGKEVKKLVRDADEAYLESEPE
jgi:hypothetical protein